MSYMALYRKFRPQTFEQVRGQDHVVRTLKNQIRNNRIGHAYLFTGTRGTGKTSVAKLFARAINCLHPQDGDPCNACEACLAAARDSFMDIVEVDAASNTSVDDIRRIIDEIQYTPVNGRYKVYIIDEAHMLSGSAFNAFLKTLEEPPSYAVFILATTEPHKLPITILSRCQRYDFHRISNETIAENLSELVKKEGVEAEEKALSYIARMGDGSMRDSISLLDKCIAFNLGDTLTYENVLTTLGVVDTEVFSRIFRAVLAGDAASALKELEQAVNDGKDITQFVNDFVWYLRNLLVVNVSKGAGDDLLGISEENLHTLKEDAAIADPQTLMRYIRIQSELMNDIRYSPVKQILVEVSFIKLAKPQMEHDEDSLADRMRQLEAGAARIPAAAQTQRSSLTPTLDDNVRADQSGSYARSESAKAQNNTDDNKTLSAHEELTRVVISVQNTDSEPTATAGPRQETGASVGSTPTGIICASWPDIVSVIPGGRLKIALKQSHPADETGETVGIYASNEVGYEIIKAALKQVEEAILKVTGKSVKAAAFRPGESPKPASDTTSVLHTGSSAEQMQNAAPATEHAQAVQAASIFPEELLKNIHFEIGTEES